MLNLQRITSYAAMSFFCFRKKKVLDMQCLGLDFKNPIGIRDVSLGGRAGFVTMTQPQDRILDWILKIQEVRNKTVLATNVSMDLAKTFSLVYDFSDLIMIDPDGDHGIDSPDISDTSVLLDEIVSLRLCYEHYTPIAFRLSHGHTPDEIDELVNHCRLSGIDAIVAPGVHKVAHIIEMTQGRLPVIGQADSQEEALECLNAGACLVETSLGPIGLAKLIKTLSQK